MAFGNLKAHCAYILRLFGRLPSVQKSLCLLLIYAHLYTVVGLSTAVASGRVYSFKIEETSPEEMAEHLTHSRLGALSVQDEPVRGLSLKLTEKPKKLRKNSGESRKKQTLFRQNIFIKPDGAFVMADLSSDAFKFKTTPEFDQANFSWKENGKTVFSLTIKPQGRAVLYKLNSTDYLKVKTCDDIMLINRLRGRSLGLKACNVSNNAHLTLERRLDLKASGKTGRDGTILNLPEGIVTTPRMIVYEGLLKNQGVLKGDSNLKINLRGNSLMNEEVKGKRPVVKAAEGLEIIDGGKITNNGEISGRKTLTMTTNVLENNRDIKSPDLKLTAHMYVHNEGFLGSHDPKSVLTVNAFCRFMNTGTLKAQAVQGYIYDLQNEGTVTSGKSIDLTLLKFLNLSNMTSGRFLSLTTQSTDVFNYGLISAEDRVRIRALGDFQNHETIESAQGEVVFDETRRLQNYKEIRAKKVSITAKEFENTGVGHGEDSFFADVEQARNEGLLTSDKELRIGARKMARPLGSEGSWTNTGTIQSPAIEAAFSRLMNEGTIEGAVSLDLAVQDGTNTGDVIAGTGDVIEGETLKLEIEGQFANLKTIRSLIQAYILVQGRLDNSGEISAFDRLTFSGAGTTENTGNAASQKAIVLNQEHFHNHGSLASGDALELALGQTFHNHATGIVRTAGKTTITGNAQLTNEGASQDQGPDEPGVILEGAVTFKDFTGTLDNRGCWLNNAITQGAIADFQNRHMFTSLGDYDLTIGAFLNTAALEGNGRLAIRKGKNVGDILSAQNLTLEIQDQFSNLKTIRSSAQARVVVGGTFDNFGTVEAPDRLTFSGAGTTNNTGNAASQKAVVLNQEHFHNYGSLISGDALELALGRTFHNHATGSVRAKGETVVMGGAHVINEGASQDQGPNEPCIILEGAVTFRDFTGILDNRGYWLNKAATQGAIADFQNRHMFTSLGDYDLTIERFLNDALLTGGGTLSLREGANAGVIEGCDLTLDVSGLLSHQESGVLKASSLKLSGQGSFTTEGMIAAPVFNSDIARFTNKGRLDLTNPVFGESLQSWRNEGVFKAGTLTFKAGGQALNEGTLEITGDLTSGLATFANEGDVTAKKADLTGLLFKNAASGTLTLKEDSLFNVKALENDGDMVSKGCIGGEVVSLTNRNLIQTRDKIELTGRTFTNDGKMVGLQGVSYEGREFVTTVRSEVTTPETLSLTLASPLTNLGLLKGDAQISLHAPAFINAGQCLSATTTTLPADFTNQGTADLRKVSWVLGEGGQAKLSNASAGDLTLHDSSKWDGRHVLENAGKATLHNSTFIVDQVANSGQLYLSAGAYHAKEFWTNEGSIKALKVDFTGGLFKNAAGGTLTLEQDSVWTMESLENDGDIVSLGRITGTIAQLTNRKLIQAQGRIDLRGATFANDGEMTAGQGVRYGGRELVTTARSEIKTPGALILTLAAPLNNKGLLRGDVQTALHAPAFINAGQCLSAAATTLPADFVNQGTADLRWVNWVTAPGGKTILSNASGASLTVRDTDAWNGVTAFNNAGDMTVEASPFVLDQITNTGALYLSTGAYHVKGAYVSGPQGRAVLEGTRARLSSYRETPRHVTLLNNEDVVLSASSFSAGGSFESPGGLNLVFGDALPAFGRLKAGSSLELIAAGPSANAAAWLHALNGKLEYGSVLKVYAPEFKNSGSLSFPTPVEINCLRFMNADHLQAQGLTVKTQSFVNGAVGKLAHIESQGGLEIVSQQTIDSKWGGVFARGPTSLTAVSGDVEFGAFVEGENFQPPNAVLRKKFFGQLIKKPVKNPVIVARNKNGAFLNSQDTLTVKALRGNIHFDYGEIRSKKFMDLQALNLVRVLAGFVGGFGGGKVTARRLEVKRDAAVCYITSFNTTSSKRRCGSISRRSKYSYSSTPNYAWKDTSDAAKLLIQGGGLLLDIQEGSIFGSHVAADGWIRNRQNRVIYLREASLYALEERVALALKQNQRVNEDLTRHKLANFTIANSPSGALAWLKSRERIELNDGDFTLTGSIQGQEVSLRVRSFYAENTSRTRAAALWPAIIGLMESLPFDLNRSGLIEQQGAQERYRYAFRGEFDGPPMTNPSTAPPFLDPERLTYMGRAPLNFRNVRFTLSPDLIMTALMATQGSLGLFNQPGWGGEAGLRTLAYRGQSVYGRNTVTLEELSVNPLATMLVGILNARAKAASDLAQKTRALQNAFITPADEVDEVDFALVVPAKDQNSHANEPGSVIAQDHVFVGTTGDQSHKNNYVAGPQSVIMTAGGLMERSTGKYSVTDNNGQGTVVSTEYAMPQQTVESNAGSVLIIGRTGYQETAAATFAALDAKRGSSHGDTHITDLPLERRSITSHTKSKKTTRNEVTTHTHQAGWCRVGRDSTIVSGLENKMALTGTTEEAGENLYLEGGELETAARISADTTSQSQTGKRKMSSTNNISMSQAPVVSRTVLAAENIYVRNRIAAINGADVVAKVLYNQTKQGLTFGPTVATMRYASTTSQKSGFTHAKNITEGGQEVAANTRLFVGRIESEGSPLHLVSVEWDKKKTLVKGSYTEGVRHLHSWRNSSSHGFHISPAVAAVISLSVGIATAGTGSAFAVSFLTFAEGGTLAAMAGAGFTALCSQAAVSLAANGGNPFKTMEDLASTKTLRSIAASVASAGVLKELAKGLDIKMDGPKSWDGHLQSSALRSSVSAGAGMAIQGQSPKEALEQMMRGTIAGTLGGFTANKICDAYRTDDLDFITHKIAHASLGAMVGAILSKDPVRGAASGALGALTAETVADLLKEDAEVVAKRVMEKSIREGRPLDDAALRAAIEENMRSKADIGRLAGASAACAAGLEVDIAIAAADNAIENNYLILAFYAANAALIAYTAYEVQNTFREEGVPAGLKHLGIEVAIQASGAGLAKGGAKLAKLGGKHGGKILEKTGAYKFAGRTYQTSKEALTAALDKNPALKSMLSGSVDKMMRACEALDRSVVGRTAHKLEAKIVGAHAHVDQAVANVGADVRRRVTGTLGETAAPKVVKKELRNSPRAPAPEGGGKKPDPVKPAVKKTVPPVKPPVVKPPKKPVTPVKKPETARTAPLKITKPAERKSAPPRVTPSATSRSNAPATVVKTPVASPHAPPPPSMMQHISKAEKATGELVIFERHLKDLPHSNDKLIGDLAPSVGRREGYFKPSQLATIQTKKYIREVEAVTGRSLPFKQRRLLKQALQENAFPKLGAAEANRHRYAFKAQRNKLIAEWEDKTHQVWPTRKIENLQENVGEGLLKQRRYDAHEIIPNSHGGPLEWFNIHPARAPDQHQRLIHGKDSVLSDILKNIPEGK